MQQRGSIELSFNFIVSIIIIGVIIATVVYALMYFLDLQRCTTLGLFYKDLQTEVDRAWESEIARTTFSGDVPGGIRSVCIGNVTLGAATDEYDILRRYRTQSFNLFFYPPEKACDMPTYRLNHIDERTASTFFCAPVRDNSVSFTVTKDAGTSLVRVTQ